MKPCALTEIPTSHPFAIAVSHINNAGVKMTYLPICDWTGQFRGSMYTPAECLKNFSLYLNF
jgi:hypothetical protein